MPVSRRITMRKIKDVLRLKLDAQLSHECIQPLAAFGQQRLSGLQQVSAGQYVQEFHRRRYATLQKCFCSRVGAIASCSACGVEQ
jgi:hypothetical protein